MQKYKSNGVKKSNGVFYAEELLPNVRGGLFCLVRIAIDRALELAEGKPSVILSAPSTKVTTIALEEIAQGKLFYEKRK